MGRVPRAGKGVPVTKGSPLPPPRPPGYVPRKTPGPGCLVTHFRAPNTTCILDIGHVGVHESRNGQRWWGQVDFPGRDPKRSLPDRPQLAWKAGISAREWPSPDSPHATPSAAAQNATEWPIETALTTLHEIFGEYGHEQLS